MMYFLICVVLVIKSLEDGEREDRNDYYRFVYVSYT